MESHRIPDNPQPRSKRPLLSGFDKIVVVIVLLILAYFLSARLGCPMKTVEEKVEWVD